MRVLDLFSGIGGFSLGLERAGMTTAMFCEIEPFCRRVLAKHWPGVPIHDDVRTMGAELLARHGVAVDLVCGGFPCQDLSVAGKGAGLTGSRSGLWFEYLRVIEETRPRWVVIENVPALRSRGLDIVLGGLAALGYDAEWHCIPAAAVGAPHRRDRVWIVANTLRAEPPHRNAEPLRSGATALDAQRRSGASDDVANTARHERAEQAPGGAEWQRTWACGAEGGTGDVANANSDGGPPSPPVAEPSVEGLSAPERQAVLGTGRWDEGRAASECGWWRAEPDVGRVAHGVPSRVDRLRSLGNAVVPQVVEVIGRAIMAAEVAR